MKSIAILKREPAFWVGLGGTLIALLGTVFGFSSVQEGWWSAGDAALVGVVVAFMTHDGIVAAVLGLLKAAIVLCLGYHWIPGLQNVSADQQAAVYTVLAMIVAMFTRTQVTATVDAAGKAVPPPPA